MKIRNKKEIFKRAMACVLGANLAVGVIPYTDTEYVTAKEVQTTSTESAVVLTSSNSNKIKNVIFMIPDGGGIPSYEIAKAVKAAGGVTYAGTKQTSTKMYMDEYLIGNYTTCSNDNSTTDSAAGGTALSSGIKTNNGTVGLDPDQAPIANLLEFAQLQNKATGIIVNSFTSDATPGAFSAHTLERESGTDIMQQILNQNINLVLGGCMKYHASSLNNLPRDKKYTKVKKKADLFTQAEKSYTDASEELKLWGDFAKGSEHHLVYEAGYGKNYDGVDDSDAHTPTMAEMMDSSLKLLSQDKDGFFLMMEGSKLDYANHHRSMSESATEWIALDEAFKVALDYAKEHKDTMIVVAPDHNTGINAVPTKKNMEEIVKLVKKQASTKERYDLIEYSEKSATGSSRHTSMNVGLWMYVPEGTPSIEEIINVDKEKPFVGDFTVDNTQISSYITTVTADENVKNLTQASKKLFYDVSKMGSYQNETFTFKDYNASVKANTDELTVNGRNLNANGQVNIYSNGKMYISQYAYKLITGIDLSKEQSRLFEGDGSKKKPYQISSPSNLQDLVDCVNAGNTYAGQYFVQTCNIDMTKLSDFAGMDASKEFAANYNGQGHTIKLAIKKKKEGVLAVFPTVTGSIQNLGLAGAITNKISACAGFAAKVAKEGMLLNVWSSVDLEAETVYGIAMEQKGKCIHSYSAMDATIPTVAKINADKAAAAKLAGVSADSLCDFTDVKGEKFAFLAGVSKLVDFTYTYTCYDGSEKTVSVPNFNPDKTGYDVTILDEKMNPNCPITSSGVAMDNGVKNTVVGGRCNLDTKGCGNVATVVSSEYSHGNYKTTSSTRYSILFNGPASGQATATPKVTTTPKATATPKVTTTPKATATPKVTTTPKATATPKVTVTPKATATPIVTESPLVSGKPTENTFVVYYKRSERTSWKDAYVHYKLNGIWTKTPGMTMQKVSAGYWVFSVAAKDAEKITLCFNNGSGSWDSNSGKNYVLHMGTYEVNQTNKTVVKKDDIGTSATPSVEPTTSVVPTASMAPTAVVTATPTVLPTEFPVKNMVTVYYKRGEQTSWESAYAHYQVNGVWTKAPGYQMEELNAGYWKITISLGEADTALMCFNNGEGTWDNNDSKKYTVKTGTYLVDKKSKTVSQIK